MVLEHPGGEVLRMLLARGREGVCSHPSRETMAKAIEQLQRWGFARFAEDGPGKWRYRVTPLGIAADSWGWARRIG